MPRLIISSRNVSSSNGTKVDNGIRFPRIVICPFPVTFAAWPASWAEIPTRHMVEVRVFSRSYRQMDFILPLFRYKAMRMKLRPVLGIDATLQRTSFINYLAKPQVYWQLDLTFGAVENSHAMSITARYGQRTRQLAAGHKSPWLRDTF